MDFLKMRGLGNDFIIVEARSWQEADSLQSLAKIMCDGHLGIGADALVAMGADEELDIFVRVYNSDGLEPELCGNAVRCAAHYAYAHKWVNKQDISVRTAAGVRHCAIQASGHKIQAVRVDMGEPILENSLCPIMGEDHPINFQVDTFDGKFDLTVVAMGNPHCIVFVPELELIPLSIWGPALESHPIFPAETEFVFVQVISRQEIALRVWKKGNEITTRTCGTGACAALVAAVMGDRTERTAVIHAGEGDIGLEWNEEDNHVYMTGAAVEVFTGRIEV